VAHAETTAQPSHKHRIDLVIWMEESSARLTLRAPDKETTGSDAQAEADCRDHKTEYRQCENGGVCVRMEGVGQTEHFLYYMRHWHPCPNDYGDRHGARTPLQTDSGGGQKQQSDDNDRADLAVKSEVIHGGDCGAGE
jgi:hypothetical protein